MPPIADLIADPHCDVHRLLMPLLAVEAVARSLQLLHKNPPKLHAV